MLRQLYPIPIFDDVVAFTDVGITDELAHKYYIRVAPCNETCTNANTREKDGDRICLDHMERCDTSMTSFLGSFLNKQFVAEEVSDNKARNDLRRELCGKQVAPDEFDRMVRQRAEQLQGEWKFASAYGHQMHALVEDFYNNRMTDAEATEKGKQHPRYFGAFLRYHKEKVVKRGWRPLRAELRPYDRKTRLPGTIDMLYVDPLGHIIMVDWKFSKNVKPKAHHFGKFFVGVEPHLDGTDYNKYELQLNAYRFILHRETDIRIHRMYLGVFHEELSDMYDEFKVPIKQNYIEQMWRMRLTHLPAITQEQYEVAKRENRPHILKFAIANGAKETVD